MSKVTIEIEVPENIKGTELEKKLLAKVERQALEQAVLELYKEGEISTETGARMLGVSLWEFMPFLGRNQISVFDYSEQEWQEELNIIREESKRPLGESGRTE